MNEDPEVAAMIGALARYLEANRLACDTPEGISRWWLPEPVVSMEKLTGALEWMRRNGLVESSVAADGRLRYRCIASDEQLKMVERRPWITRH
jgi:hypothetical protein